MWRLRGGCSQRMHFRSKWPIRIQFSPPLSPTKNFHQKSPKVRNRHHQRRTSTTPPNTTKSQSNAFKQVSNELESAVSSLDEQRTLTQPPDCQYGCHQATRQARQGHPRPRPNRYANLEALIESRLRGILTVNRLSRWRHAGPRRVHGRPEPINYPQRQGPGITPTS